MLYPIKHLPVNWVDGMKISRRHFTETDNSVADMLRDQASVYLTKYNFGLMPPYHGQKVSTDFEITEKTNHDIEVRLKSCNAITAGGCRIDIAPLEYADHLILNYSTEQVGANSQKQKAAPASLAVILSVNPFEKAPAGQPDPEEVPLRHPSAGKTYRLMVVPSDQVNAYDLGSHHLVIGKLHLTAGHYAIDHQYIPPCTAVTSHPRLIEYYEKFSAILNSLQLNALKILQKIAAKDNQTDIALSIKLLSEKLLDYISMIYFQYRNLDHQHPPVVMVRYFSTIANIFYTSISFLGGRKAEELLKYFYEWKDVTPGNFEELLSNTIELVYDHHNIEGAMGQVERLMKVLDALFKELSLLEYIGQRKENIVVAEKRTLQQPETKRGWTLLD